MLTSADRARLDAIFARAATFTNPLNVLCARCGRGTMLYDGRTISAACYSEHGRKVTAWHAFCYGKPPP